MLCTKPITSQRLVVCRGRFWRAGAAGARSEWRRRRAPAGGAAGGAAERVCGCIGGDGRGHGVRADAGRARRRRAVLEPGAGSLWCAYGDQVVGFRMVCECMALIDACKDDRAARLPPCAVLDHTTSWQRLHRFPARADAALSPGLDHQLVHSRCCLSSRDAPDCPAP